MKAPATRLPPTTLTSLLQDEIIPIETLLQRHGSAATIAKTLLGVVPNTGKYLEIWPPANRMYYFMVPCFLNLPAFMFGFGAPKNLVSLALYSSSLAAGCPYCTSHTCTFAIRRGVETNKLNVEALEGRNGASSEVFTPVEKSVLDVAFSLAQFPCKLTNKQRNNMREQLKDAATTESVLLAMAMMGYLNKSMDALGMPLEVETYRETRDVMGETWSAGQSSQLLDPALHTAEAPPSTDSFMTYWTMVTQGPSASNFERKALAGIPDKKEEAAKFLTNAYGYDFPVLQSMYHARAIQAVTGMIHEALNPDTSVIGVKVKIAIGQIFASVTQSKPIQDAINAVAKHFNVEQNWLESAKTLAGSSDPIAAAKEIYSAETDSKTRALLVVGHAASWSPAQINEQTVALCSEADVASPALVEVVAVVSMLQMLHRISAFYLVDPEDRATEA